MRKFQKDELFLFYGSSDLFSNWNYCGFVVKGIYFKTGEHFLMYCKAMLFGDFEIAAQILIAQSPAQAKALGRQVRGFVEDVWKEKRIGYMVRGCLAKAEQHKDVGELLDSLVGKTIVEASPTDRIWGVRLGKDHPDIYDESKWRGLNLLGKSFEMARDIRLKEREKS
jgi:ribA/ribD-fused uncharacterized protein